MMMRKKSQVRDRRRQVSMKMNLLFLMDIYLLMNSWIKRNKVFNKIIKIVNIDLQIETK